MKVILMRDVAKLGLRHSVVEVPDGYAQNKLIPQGLAKPATPANLKLVKARGAHDDAQKAANAAAFKGTVEALADQKVLVKANANEQGHLFKGVKASDISTAVSNLGLTLDENTIIINEPIKTVGEHEVLLQAGDVNAKITVTVEAE